RRVPGSGGSRGSKRMKKMQWILAAMTAVPAFAEAPAPSPAQGIGPVVPMILIFGGFYFFVIRPQQKKQKLHDQFLKELKKGDMVVTNAGIIGTVKQLSEKFVQLEVDEGVCLKILRSQVLESANSLKEEPKGKPVPVV